ARQSLGAQGRGNLASAPGRQFDPPLQRTRVHRVAHRHLVRANESNTGRDGVSRTETMTGRQIDRIGVGKRDTAGSAQLELLVENALCRATFEDRGPALVAIGESVR